MQTLILRREEVKNKHIIIIVVSGLLFLWIDLFLFILVKV